MYSLSKKWPGLDGPEVHVHVAISASAIYSQ